MTELELRQIVDEVLARMGRTPAQEAPFDSSLMEEALPDIALEDLRRQYLVDNPRDQAAFLAMKERTPARVGVGHAGARYKTQT
ncbi:MAG: ethanolamine ammonia-lyase, partial [Clostridia bacterium]|nr:ethanolamine ammonia-lyase [Clostridia bacterium]